MDFCLQRVIRLLSKHGSVLNNAPHALSEFIQHLLSPVELYQHPALVKDFTLFLLPAAHAS